MKNAATSMWKSVGITGRIFLACFLFYFICKTFKS